MWHLECSDLHLDVNNGVFGSMQRLTAIAQVVSPAALI